jgi:hypothetical protein
MLGALQRQSQRKAQLGERLVNYGVESTSEMKTLLNDRDRNEFRLGFLTFGGIQIETPRGPTRVTSLHSKPWSPRNGDLGTLPFPPSVANV